MLANVKMFMILNEIKTHCIIEKGKDKKGRLLGGKLKMKEKNPRSTKNKKLHTNVKTGKPSKKNL